MLLARAVVAAAAGRCGPPRAARRPADRTSALDTVVFAYDDDVRSAAAKKRRRRLYPGSRDGRSPAQAEYDAADDAERARARRGVSGRPRPRALRDESTSHTTATTGNEPVAAPYSKIRRAVWIPRRHRRSRDPDSKLRDVLHCRFFVSDPAVKRARHRCHVSLVLLDREGAACDDDDELWCAVDEPIDEEHSCLGRWAFTKAEAQEDAFRELLTNLREKDAKTAAIDRRRRVNRRR